MNVFDSRGWADRDRGVKTKPQEPPEIWVEWVEPFGPNNEPVYMRVPKSTAIAYIKGRLKRELTDEEAFEEFCVVYWASIKA